MSLFQINKLNIVSSWGYNLDINKDCAICKNYLNEDSLYNQDQNLESKICEGICGHIYHDECIRSWVHKYKTCPLCSSKWTSKV